MESIAIIKVSEFRGANARADKNGLAPMFLSPLAGKIPNRAMILSGTMAQRDGIFENDTIMVQFTETEADAKYGRQFTVTNLGIVTRLEYITLKKELGAPEVIDVTKAEPVAKLVEEEAL